MAEDQSAKDQDRFTRMMFGPGRGGSEQPEAPRQEDSRNAAHDSIDYAQLMDVIESLADTADKLKPYVSKIYPAIQQIWKKK